MKVALLGTGFGQAHAAVYATRGVEVIVFGRTSAKLDEIRKRYGFTTTTDLNDLYDDASIELVDVCLPTAVHAEHVMRALTAGKHVLCELPLALTLDDARRVADAAEASDRKVFVDMYNRFSPANRVLQDALADRSYGQLRTLEIDSRTALLWPGYDLRLDTIVLDMLHGSVDTVVQALGMPESFNASAVNGDGRGSAVHIALTYRDAIARLSGIALMPQSYGSQGGYRATFSGGVLEHNFAAGFTGQPSEPVVHEYTEEGHRALAAEGPDTYTSMIDHVLNCLRGQEVNRIAPASVLDSLRLTLDIHNAVN